VVNQTEKTAYHKVSNKNTRNHILALKRRKKELGQGITAMGGLAMFTF
jgi:hypothetical protein